MLQQISSIIEMNNKKFNISELRMYRKDIEINYYYAEDEKEKFYEGMCLYDKLSTISTIHVKYLFVIPELDNYYHKILFLNYDHIILSFTFNNKSIQINEDISKEISYSTSSSTSSSSINKFMIK